jgi:hypothetical protein
MSENNNKFIEELKKELINKVVTEERNKLLNQQTRHKKIIFDIIDKVINKLPPPKFK